MSTSKHASPSATALEQWVISALESARKQLDLCLWAYVIMPEHVHLLLCPKTQTYEMRKILVALKRPVSDAAREYLESVQDDAWIKRLSVEYPSRNVFRFWQPGGGFDRNIVQQKSVWSVIDYIHANPVRRGLAKRAVDWEWSSARFWEGEANPVLSMDNLFS